MQELRLAFDSVDDDKSGSISSEELYKLFHNFGVDIDQEETEELLQNLDMDGKISDLCCLKLLKLYTAPYK